MLQTEQQILRLGVVNFLNATPLIDGIPSISGIELVPKVPSDLVGCLENWEVDVALASSIDYQKSKSELSILPVGVLSSEGETLTVRLCSKIPFDEIKEVHCDTDSHTSVALLQIILQDSYGTSPKITSSDIRNLQESNAWPETILMIGDKVVTSETENVYPLQLDLGDAWFTQTKLPFVFAMWFGESSLDNKLVHRASIVLDRQRRYNAFRIEEVVSEHASKRGWHTDLAFRYLTEHIEYIFTNKHKQSLSLFFDKAFSLGLIETVKPLQFYEV